MITEALVISDTHFFDKKIIKNLKRPFKNLQEMHEEIIIRWNRVVKPDDIVIHLGDFSCWYNFDQLREIVNNLNGYKVLVKGNHDILSSMCYKQTGFDRVVDNTLRMGEYIFSHVPLSYKYMKSSGIATNFHGHSHKYVYGQGYVNCNVDISGFTPRRIKLWDIHRRQLI